MRWPRHLLILALAVSFNAHAQNAPAATLKNAEENCRFPTRDPANPCLDRFDTPELDAVNQAMMTHWERVQASLGSAYAGTWIDYDVNDKAYQVIALTRPMSIDKDYVTQTRLNIVYVTFSDRELQAVSKDIGQRFMLSVNKPGEVRITSVGADPKNNCVEVSVLKKDLENVGNQLTQAGYNMNLICLREGQLFSTM